VTTPIKTSTDNFPRVIRGGGWLSGDAARVRAAARFTRAPANRDDYLGFRCAQRGVRQPVGKVNP
jgi:formylglycine-generating enzyme required for sulfatase activity